MQITIINSADNYIEIESTSSSFIVNVSELSAGDLITLNDFVNLNIYSYIEYFSCYDGLEVFMFVDSYVIVNETKEFDYSSLSQIDKDKIDNFVTMINTYNI